jgi:hypothetical protein
LERRKGKEGRLAGASHYGLWKLCLKGGAFTRHHHDKSRAQNANEKLHRKFLKRKEKI